MAYHFPYATRFHRLKSARFIAQTSKIKVCLFNLTLPHFITLIWNTLSDKNVSMAWKSKTNTSLNIRLRMWAFLGYIRSGQCFLWSTCSYTGDMKDCWSPVTRHHFCISQKANPVMFFLKTTTTDTESDFDLSLHHFPHVNKTSEWPWQHLNKVAKWINMNILCWVLRFGTYPTPQSNRKITGHYFWSTQEILSSWLITERRNRLK